MVRRQRRIGVIGLCPAGVIALPVTALGDGPRAHAACARNATGTCSEAGNVSLLPNASGAQTTDTVPDDSSISSETIEPLGATDLAAFDSTWDTVVAGAPKLGKIKNLTIRRVLTCAVIAKGVASMIGADDVHPSDSIDTNDIYAAYLSICIHVTVLGQRKAAGHAIDAAASPTCHTSLVAVPFTATRTAHGYHIVVDTMTKRSSGRGALRVSCRLKGRGLLISERPRGRAHSLRRTIGPHLGIGFSNPTSRPVAFRTTFTFR